MSLRCDGIGNSNSIQKTAFNFNNVCRLCMSRGKPLVPIFDEEGMLSIRIMSLVPLVKLHVDDGLPSQVCQQCEYQVNTSYKFQLQCEKSNATLRQCRAAAQSSYLTVTGSNTVNEETTVASHICEAQDSDYNFQDSDDDAPKLNVTECKDLLKQKKSDEVTFEMKGFIYGKNSHRTGPVSRHHSCVSRGRIRSERSTKREYKEVDVQMNRNMKNSTDGISTQISQLEENSYVYDTELLACHMCGKMFPCKSKLQEHSTKHTGVRPYACGVCRKRFTRRSSLNVHVLSHTGHKPHSCELCGKQFTQLSTLKNHALTHTGQKPRVCEVCGRRFARLDNLKSHVLIHTSHKSYVCEVCGKMFNKMVLLKTHATTHMERKPLFCDVCGKSFVNVYRYKTHALIHSGEKPFTCGICKKSFTLKNSLKIHIQTHTGFKPHECGVCGKRFSQSHSLKTHAVVHTGQRPFSCQVCGKCFKQRHSLKKHERIHTTCNIK